MPDIATKTRAGLMGPNHIRRLGRVEAAVKDPLIFTDVVPTLDLDFRNINGAPFVGNFARATIGGYRLNEKGVLVPTVVNEPLIDFGSDGKALGTGFWGAYTNLVLRSEEFDNAAWTKTRATITANSSAAPDGATTMDKLVEDTTASDTHFTIMAGIAKAAGATDTASIFLKAGERTKGSLRLQGSSGQCIANFDLTAGTVTAQNSGTGTGASAVIDRISSSIFRVSISGVATAADTNVGVGIYLHDASGNSSYTGDGASGIYIWGAQLTATGFPVPYVPTTSATVTRNTDGGLFITGSDFTDFFNPKEGTAFVEFTPRSNINFPGVIDFYQDSNNRIGYLLNGSTMTGVFSIRSGGTTYAQINPAVSTLNVSERVAFSYGSNIAFLSRNGVAAAADTSVTLPTTLTALRVGLYDDILSGHIKRVTYWPKALSDLELRRMTA